MTTRINARVAASLRFISKSASVLAVLLGFSVLVGWSFDVVALKTVLPELVTMKANTSVSFVLAGVSLWLLQPESAGPWSRRIGRGCAVIVALVGLLTFSEYLVGWDLGIDQLLFKEPLGAVRTFAPGRMAPITALNFLLLGLALLLLDMETSRGHRPAEPLILAAGLFAFLALIGYLYGVQSLHRIGPFTSVALHTAVTFVALCAGILVSRPHRGLMGIVTSDGPGGVMTRRLLPALIGVPVLLGWLRLVGQRAGLYDTVFGVVMLIVSNIMIITVLLVRAARLLNLTDAHRKRAEMALRASEVKFRELLEAAPDAVVIIGRDGKIAMVNAQTETLFDFTKDELLGEPVELLMPERFRSTHPQHCEGYFATPRMTPMNTRRELSGLRKDGREVAVDIALSSHQTEEGIVVLAIIRDITERKRAEATRQALYQASLEIQEPLRLRDRLDRLLRAAQTVLDLDRVNILLADSTGQWLEGVASTEPDAAFPTLRIPIGPEGGGLAEAYQTRQMIAWTGQAPMPEGLRLKPPYDTIAALRSQIFANVPLVVQGKAIGVLGADRKHSRRPLDSGTLELLQLFAAQAALAIEHGRLYEAQRLAAIQLEATVEARTRELQAANARLQEESRKAEEASRHKSEFLANMSHELRTPLNSIIGFSELLQDPTFGPLIEKQARYVDHIHKSGKHLLALINDLLDLSKVETGKLELRPEPFELREALTAALTETRLQAEAKRLQLELQVDPALTTLTADPLRFKQIMLNLISNAVKFTPDGGRVTVSARIGSRGEGLGFSEGSRLDPKPSTLYPGEFVELTVTDTGIGIKPEDLPRLFQPFTQLESPFAKRHQGTGLGLALTKRLVELHGGIIWTESEGEGRGTTFKIRIPLSRPA